MEYYSALEKNKITPLAAAHMELEILNIDNYQGNANQNYNEVSPHTGQNCRH